MADVFAIRVLTRPQIQEVYTRRLIEDFPPDERKPLQMIERALDLGKYVCYGYFIGERMAAYAFFAKAGKPYWWITFRWRNRCVIRDWGAGSCRR